MRDLNFIVIEGIISSQFYTRPANENGMAAVNFTITNYPSGNKKFKYSCVAWRLDPDKFTESFQFGDSIRITGHLQQVLSPLAEDKVTYLGKICADKVELVTSA